MSATPSSSLRRVLIANRGEIAIRIAAAAADLGIESVSVSVAIDSEALHTRVTDANVELPANPSGPVAAYLDAASIIAAAVAENCDGVHPGYGFLSENADFADQCAAAGLTFVGPSAEALRLFGDKVSARALAISLDIPVVAGSDGAVATSADAAAVASDLGYPVMLKASGGGGGRGMRRVDAAEEMDDAFARCSSEALSAFGNGDVFLEQLVQRPRHIEVQVLADGTGETIHLGDRDCSVQIRNQKVIEIAPAPELDEALRDRLRTDAVRLVNEAGYLNAGTVEFLVEPETGRYFFIECNPRIQVEHTVTEQVTGLDLVAAQFRIAGGATLAELALNQEDITIRGNAVQARIVATGAGTITGYKEPAGPGVRVDAAGYAGYAPPPQFDPLLGKVIATSSGTYRDAVDKLRRALGTFQITGIDTNLGQLDAILANETLRSADARTTLLSEFPELAGSPQRESGRGTIELLDAQTSASRPGSSVAIQESYLPVLDVEDGQIAIECPMAGSVIETVAQIGDAVEAGDAIVIVTAMKMETEIAAPCAGTVVALQSVAPGDAVGAGDVMAVIAPSGAAVGGNVTGGANTWGPTLNEVATLNRLAAERLGPDSEEPGVVRQRNRNKLTCRERVALLLDDASFREVGSVAGFASYDEFGEISAFTPANSVGGQGTIDRRSVVVCADDFTSRGGHADGAIGAKSLYLDRLSMELQVPSVRLLDGSSGGGSVTAMVPKQKTEGESSAKESSGAITAGRPRVSGGGGSFLPAHLGSSDYTRQLATVPVVNMLLGSVVGLGAAKAVLGHFSVMVRDIAQLFVAGPPVVSHAMGYDITKEDLGDWRIHCLNGSVDNLAETEEEAAAMTRRFLSYLPPSVHEAPPVLPPTTADPADRRDDELFTIVPRKRTTTFDIRRAIELIADRDSFFEIGSMWGTDQVTGFVRMNGYPMGIVASDSRHLNGGALTADGCDKIVRHLDLCDLFHIPVLNLVDNPGFAVGVEHEVAGTIRKGGEWMVAFAQLTVPMFTVLMRRSFGVAGNNFARPSATQTARVAWPSADVGGIPPEGGIEAAYKRQLAEADDPAALRAELNARIESARGPVGPLSRFELEEMIDPRDTRRIVCEWLPNAYRVLSHPNRLGPRALGYRP